MISIPLWVRLVFWAVLLVGGSWLGWNVESWREGAAQAVTLRAQLDGERAARAASEAARLKLAADLAGASAAVHTQIKESIKRVPVLVHDSRACDLSDELVGVLNRARGYDVSGAGRSAAAVPGAAAKTP